MLELLYHFLGPKKDDGVSFPRVKLMDLEVGHWHPSSVKVKNEELNFYSLYMPKFPSVYDPKSFYPLYKGPTLDHIH